MHALVRFAHIAAGSTFTTAEIYPYVIKALGCPHQEFPLASLRYDLSKLRAKGLIAKLPRSRRYQLLPCGYSICLVFLKLFERIYAPLAAGILSPIKGDARVHPHPNSTVSTNASSTISTNSLARWASKKPPDLNQTRTEFALAPL